MTAPEQGDAAGHSTDVVRGWQAAAEVAGRSIAGVRKLVADGRLRAERAPDGVNVFQRIDLEGLPPVLAGPLRLVRPDGGDRPTVSTAAELTTRPGDAATPTPSNPHIAGDVAALVFAAFEAGKSPVEVVVSSKRPPEEIEGLYATWRRMKALDVSSPDAASRIAQLESAVKEMKATTETVAGRAAAPCVDPITWATPRWMHEALANRLAVIEQVLLARGLLVRGPAPAREA